MAFNSSFLLQQTNGGMIQSGIPGLFAYITTDDNIATVLTDGYFPSDQLSSSVGAGDAIIITANDSDTNGYELRFFDSNFNLKNNSSALIVSTITASSANLSIEHLYLINNSSSGTYTLPTAVGNKGKKIIVKKISSNILTTVTIAGTIDGGSNLVLSVLNSHATLISDGANYVTV